MLDTITVLNNGRSLTFGFDVVNSFHGGGCPGGVAHALKAMQAAFTRLSDQPPERREVSILTAFSGLGGRDALEMVTRALTEDRLTIDKSIGGRDVISDPPGPYVFRIAYRERTAEAVIRPGHVKPELVALGVKKDKTEEEVKRHEELKVEMAIRLLPLPAADIYSARLIEF